MKQKIHVRLIQIAVLAILTTMICVTAVYYHLFLRQVGRDLQTNAQILANAGMFSGELQEEKKMDETGFHQDNLRITWIAADGTVLYDNDAGADSMGNHKDRPEVQEALEKGSGESIRNSSTMNMSTYYYALRLSDGTVLRVATEIRSVVNIFFSAVPLIAVILLFIILICVVLARFLTKQLLQPIEVMAKNMEDTSETAVYKELVPFMNTIRAQHENILMAAKVRQDFTANVSHELKTPLTAISGYAELIENHMVDEQQETRFAHEIRQNANRLLSLINDIIRLSELDSSDNPAISYELLNLDEVAGECVNALKVNADRRRVELHYESEPCELRADRGMICELVDNLCENAIRYNNEGGWVCVRVTKKNGRPLLEVSDNGIGIPKDQQARIFERFYRVDKSRSKQSGGTGLGLAIVKHIVALHDANIELESEPGKGTVIRVIF